MDLQRLKLSTLTELYVLQPLDIYNQPVRLGLGYRLLYLKVRQLQHVGKPRAALYERLRIMRLKFVAVTEYESSALDRS